MKMKIISLCLIAVVVLSACGKWVDVKPNDRLSQENLFSDREGFLKALNGVYVELANKAVYGENMSVSALDVLAQYYYITNTSHRFYDHTIFDYTKDGPKATFDNMWKKSYELIVNSNVIIEQCGESNPVLPAPYFGIVKGEALALRAMLHFDMLRVFGPVWSEETKNQLCIPYNKSSSPALSPLLSSDQVLTLVINDLTAAAALLKTDDPIITAGVRHAANPSGDNSLYYRQYRLNYYAVKALLARAYLWKADKPNALKEAKEILAEVQTPTNPIFPAINKDVAKDPVSPDRLFSTEVMFSLYAINRSDIYSNVFAPDLNEQLRLRFTDTQDGRARLNELYDDQQDYRYNAWVTLNIPAGAFLTHLKYADYPTAKWRYMIPLIRLSEIQLIAAECSNTLEEGTAYLNQVRTNRNSVSITPADPVQLKTAITREFRKEVIGEGQMFFYYKRNAMLAIPNNAAATGTKSITLEKYKVPLPESETSVRSN